MASAPGGAPYDAEEARAEGRRAVASEMEAIFAPLPLPTAPPVPPPSAKPRSRAKGRAWIGIVLLVLMGLIAAAVSMVFLARTSRAPLPQRPPRSAATHHAPAPAPVVPASALRQPIVAPLINPPPVAPAPAQTRPRAAPHTTKSKAIHRSIRPRSRPVKRDTRRAAPARKGRCDPGATSPWCLRGAVVEADDRLRDAYDTAVRAGVDRKTLVGIRSDWKRLRGRANREPQALIRGYALLTQELHAEARRAARQ
jgi:hypothetical protein